ncbi:hypothetical protein [Pseudomonas veronii]|uniref:hypothetical protein n=1 Tax=Pseudomonas veronii TaxID=76761 RepID=UPI00265AEA95|nr:hypothetical protein [Pseudomonas veronii]WKC47351.1 hypothetical protein QYP03_02620 [Pseudomonas veronii]
MQTSNRLKQATGRLSAIAGGCALSALVGGLSLMMSGCAVPTATAHLYQIQPKPTAVADQKLLDTATLLQARIKARNELAELKKPPATDESIKAAKSKFDAADLQYKHALDDLKNARASRVTADLFSTDNTHAIRKPDSNGSGGDVFAVYLTDAYFKYLKDFGGVNEVLIVAEFTEVGNDEKTETITKVLGPYLGVADGANPPILNKLLYGPKKLDSDHLSMKLTVLEYDQGENEDTAAFLDFIGSASKTLSLANPVTAAEQVFAKEVAKSLLALNKDDVVMQIDMDMVARPADATAGENGAMLPLNPGNYVLINQERCAPANCYFYLTGRGNQENPLAWIGDSLMLIPTAIRRGWTDTPDRASLQDIDLGADGIEPGNHGLRKGSELFKDKTWLSFSVVKGGDAGLWGRRRALIEAEQAVQSINKKSTSALLMNAGYERARTALDTAQALELTGRNGISFVSPLNDKGEFAPSATTNTSFCLSHNKPVNSPTYRVFNLEDTPPTEVKGLTLVSVNGSTNLACFNYAANTLHKGRHQLVVTSSGEMMPVIQSVPFVVVP